MKKRIERDNQLFEISVTYNKGGHSWATGRQLKRGYYLHVQPITIQDMGNGIQAVRMVGFSGVKMFLHEVSRQSKKQYEYACDLVTDELIDKMIVQCNF